VGSPAVSFSYPFSVVSPLFSCSVLTFLRHRQAFFSDCKKRPDDGGLRLVPSSPFLRFSGDPSPGPTCLFFSLFAAARGNFDLPPNLLFRSGISITGIFGAVSVLAVRR